MKKSTWMFGLVFALLLSGCGVKPYVDVESADYATLQLVPKSETLLFADDYYAFIEDYSKGCKESVMLGAIQTDSDTPSRIAKIPVETPLFISVNYRVDSGNSTFVEYTQFILTPEKGRHYVVLYEKKDLGLFQSKSDFRVFMQNGDKMAQIPESRMRSFVYENECN